MGSLFDGIGVFPLAAIRCGITPIWASEIEKAPVSITKRHFPDMAHLGDITKLDGGKIEPVKIISFGSPCVDFSTIGCREGIAGVQSGLFYQAIRIINEMKEATNGKFPVIAIWENVMGAISSNDRFDFRAVLESFANAEIPMPATGKWAYAGMVRGGTVDVAWRLMDARYWGKPPPPQRRRRIFILADFVGRRAGKILFKSRDVYPALETCTNSGNTAAEGNRILVDEARGQIPVIHPFQDRRMRGCAKEKDHARYLSSFGRSTDPFPTLLASSVNMFSFWYGDDYKNGILRFLTPTESERLMGLPDGYTAYGHDGKEIKNSVRCKALGNAIALPCAEYIMAGITEVLKND